MNLNLTEDQQEVVDHTLGPALVFAVAGAGKTTAMVHRIEKLVRKNVFPPKRILATSFAQANVQDLKDDLSLWPHCRPVDVRTLHSLGLNIIRRAQKHGHLTNLRIGDGDEGPGNTEQRILTLAQGQAYKRDLSFVKELDSLDRQDFLAYVGSCKSNLQYADLAAAELPEEGLVEARQAPAPAEPLGWYLDLFRLFEEIRQQLGHITYDDMLLTGWQMLVTYPQVLREVQGSYACVLVDEFQDVNKAQSEILDLVTTPHRNYMAIGDDDQTIYEWRGASPGFILQFQERYSARTYLIADNFRCPAAPLVLANQVIAHNKKRQPKRLSLTQGFRGEAKVFIDEETPAMARRIVSQIQRLRRGGHDFSDMAILVRLNAQTPHIEQNLIAAEIPYRVSYPFYERPEIKTLINYCRLAWVEQQMAVASGNPQGTAKGKAAAEAWDNIANRPKRYISSKHKVQIQQALLTGQASPSQVVRNYAQLIHEDWLADSLDKLASEILRLADNLDKPAGSALINLEIRLRYKQFLRESSGFVQTGEARAASVAAFIDYAQGHKTLFSFMQHIRELAKSSAGKPSSDSDPAVTLSTIHKAKGLEWPIVFVPQCNEGMLPFLSDSPNNNLEEERRLFYVAITRTQHTLYLYYVRGEPISRFLKQAEWKNKLNDVAKLKKILAKSANQWLFEDALAVAKLVPSLNFQRYFELWWEATPDRKQEIAHTLQHFYRSVEHHDLYRSLRLAPSGEFLWRTISPLPTTTAVDTFPGLERFIPKAETKPEISEKQKRQRRKRGREPVVRRQVVNRIPAPSPKAGPSPMERSDSLNRRIKRTQEVGELITEDAVGELIKGLSDPNVSVRYLAGAKLRQIGGLQVVESLEKELITEGAPSARRIEARKVVALIAETDADPAARQKARRILEALEDGSR